MADSTQPGEQSNKAAIRRAKKAAANKARYEANKEEILEKNRRYRIANAAKLRDRRRANGDAIRAQRRDYYKRNREKILAANRAWRAENIEQVRASDSRRYSANKEKIKERQKLYTAKNAIKNRKRASDWAKANPERVRERSKRYRENNKDKVRGYKNKSIKKRRSQDPVFCLVESVRQRIIKEISKAGVAGRKQTIELLGCTREELVFHIESQFANGMSWSNRGRYGWHIDHIIPLSKFDLSDPEQQAIAFHYTNLQPLWAADNLRKSNKVPGQSLFGFAYAVRIADAASAKPKRRRTHGRQHGGH